MLERGDGKIVNLASLLSFQGGLTVPAYAASKGAVAQLTKALCNEWAARGVNVNAVAPGYIRTTRLTEGVSAEVLDRARERSVLGRLGDPQDVANVVMFLCSELARHITGAIVPVDGGHLL
jgi:2-dehydro-3-deoxy-D-gluconate 5-dehydrogenase